MTPRFRRRLRLHRPVPAFGRGRENLDTGLSHPGEYSSCVESEWSRATAVQPSGGTCTWSLAPGAGHQVTLTAFADGNVIADAIRLVDTGPVPADLVYLHTDQIGLPQKITDATQTVVWDRVQDPFGRQVSLTNSGGIDTSLRFPGQQADPATGFAYNYFRDYDPTLGRYIQADPIGLAGGVNRYGYVNNGPMERIDLFGLEEFPDDFIGPLPPSGYWSSEMIKIKFCGSYPPPPPGVDIHENMKTANGAYDPFWFYNQVRNRGAWDYKQLNPKYEDFGNFNFGASGSASVPVPRQSCDSTSIQAKNSPCFDGSIAIALTRYRFSDMSSGLRA